VCVSCDQARDPAAACIELNPDLPLCVGEACVQCSARDTTQCTGTVPVCDAATNTCIGCTAHEQCPDSACHLADGSCLPPEIVWHVDGDAGFCGVADGSAAAPFCTIEDAFDEISPASRATVRIAATAAPYLEPVVIDGDRIVALVPWGLDPPVLDALDADPTVTIDGAIAYLWRLRLEGNGNAPAIAVDAATTYAERIVVVANDGGGIALETGAELFLSNSVVGANGTGLAERYGLDANASTFDVRYSTIAGNDGTTTPSVRCTNGGDGSIRNSIVVGLDPPSISCAGIEVATSAIDTDALGGADVVVLEDFVLGWFVDGATGDFHLVRDTLFEDVAVWEDGDPLVDLDGEPRPARDGAVDVAGADIP
jgi:hypothetical protein